MEILKVPHAPTIPSPIIWYIWKEVNDKKTNKQTTLKKNHRASFLLLYCHLPFFLVTITWVAM